VKKVLDPAEAPVGYHQKSAKQFAAAVLALRSKGYVIGGFTLNGYYDSSVLLIHKDWTKFNFTAFLAKVQQDFPIEEFAQYALAFEIPTLEMFRDRWAHEDHGHTIVFDDTAGALQ
jgi:hypothetical protein